MISAQAVTSSSSKARAASAAVLSGWIALQASPCALAADPAFRWGDSGLVGTGIPPMPFRGIDAFPGHAFDRPTDLDPAPGDPGHFIVVELEAGVTAFDAADDGTAPRRALLAGGGGRRFYSLAFDPGFPGRPVLYLSSNRPARAGDDTSRFNRVNTVSRLVLDAADPLGHGALREEAILEWPSAGHDGCDLQFGPDGMLHVSTGDGQAPGDPANLGQTTDNLLGSILRLDVRPTIGERAPYRVPEDNPFVGVEGIRPEIWAYGFRNPWKMAFRPGTDELFVGDNGDESWELVRLARRGTNHGWSAFEGSHPFRPSNPLAGPVPELTPPVHEHPHTEVRSVIGGLFYRGDALPSLRGRYVYACYFTRKLWAFAWDPADGASGSARDVRRIADLPGQPVAFAEDHGGELLVVTHDRGILRLEPNDAPAPAPPPARLSATGLFADTESLEPAAGVLPYAIRAEAWWDGARTVRHVGLPAGREAIDAAQGEWEKKSWVVPNGTAFAQTFTLPDAGGTPRRVETRILHKDGGEWRFLTYRWDDDGRDAELVPEAGSQTTLATRRAHAEEPQSLTWRFPARAECSACHTQRSFFALAFGTGQLDRDALARIPGATEGSPPVNQLRLLERLGWFQPDRGPRPDRQPVLADPREPSAALDARARAYLHVNCAHCHRETGLGGRAQFQLLHWLALDATGALGTPPLVGSTGRPDACVVAPGEPERSEILARMRSPDPGIHMPLVGSSVVDEEGVALIRAWIESL